MRSIIAAAGIAFLCGICLPADARADGEVQSLKGYLYWDSGEVRQCTIYDARTGKLKAKAFCGSDGSIQKIERFDERGNKVEEALYDGKGNLKTGVDGWAAMRWRYDGSRIVWQISYDESGDPTEQKLYSESGKLAMRFYRDDETVNPYVNAAMYTMLGGQNVRHYDPRGTFEETTRVMAE